MTEVGLQICHDNSSEGFLSNPLATCLQKFAGGGGKKQLLPSFPCTPVACCTASPTQECRVRAAHRELWCLLWCAEQGDACVTKYQGLKDSLADQVSSMLQGSHTWVALPSISAAASHPLRQQRCPGTPAILLPVLARGICFLLQPAHAPVPREATRGLRVSLTCLHWRAARLGNPKWNCACEGLNPWFPACFGLQDGERKRKGPWGGRHRQFNLIC